MDLRDGLEGRIVSLWWLFGLGKGREGKGGIQVTPRPHEEMMDRKRLFLGEDEFGCQKPMGPAGAAVERGMGLTGEKSRRP